MTSAALTRHIGTAMQREYYARPADERFPDVASMAAAAAADRALSKEITYSWRDLRWDADTDANKDAAGLYLTSPRSTAALTHWSFGQASRMLGAPAGFLRDSIPPHLAAQILNYRITEQAHGSDAVILAKAPTADRPLPQIRAITSDSYARIWDARLYGAIHQQLGDTLTAPPTWETDPTTGQPLTGGAYRGDRDSTAVLISGGSIVTDPSARRGSGSGNGQDGALYRGVIVRNSEVGSCAVHLISFLYRVICGNHLIWGISDAKAYTRRHVGTNAERDTLRELYTLARRLTTQGAEQDERIIRSLITHEIAHTRDAVIDELQGMGWTRVQATEAYDRCERTEPTLSPRAYWGLAQGATRAAQDSPYQDERHSFDILAGQLLTKGRKLVAA